MTDVKQKARAGNKELRDTSDLFSDSMSLIKFKTSESSVTLMAGFENLWEMGKTPENWKRSNIACISETKKERGRNYISVSLTKYLKKTQQPYQHNQTNFKNTQTSKEKKT